MKNHSLAKAYAIKSGYIIIAALINILATLNTQNIGMIYLGLFMFFGSCISDCYFKPVYNSATKLFRRIGYGAPIFIGFSYLVLGITSLFEEKYVSLVYSKYSLFVLIAVSVVIVLISFLDIWFYGYNDEQIQQRDRVNKMMVEERRKERELLATLKENSHKEHKEFIKQKAEKKINKQKRGK